jgi:hypothetical protein
MKQDRPNVVRWPEEARRSWFERKVRELGAALAQISGQRRRPERLPSSERTDRRDT